MSILESPLTKLSLLLVFSTAMIASLPNVYANGMGGGGWSEPVRIDSKGTVQSAVVASDAMGNAVAAWSQVEPGLEKYSIWANRYDAMKGWDKPQRITQLVGQRCFPNIDMNNAGVAVVTWCQYSPATFDPANRTYDEPTSVWISRLTPAAKAWSRPQQVADESGDPAYPSIAVDGQGNAVVVYVQDIPLGEYTVHAKRVQANGRVEADELMQRTGNNYGGTYAVATNERGQAMVIWNDVDPNTYESLYVSKIYQPKQGWANPVAINGTQGYTSYSGFGLDNNGNAMFALQIANAYYNFNAYAFRYSNAGWETPVLLQANMDLNAESLVMKLNARGEAMAIWSEYSAAPNFQMHANRYVPGQGWKGDRYIANRNNAPSFTRLALNDSGNAVALWSEPMPEFLAPGASAPPSNVFAFRFDKVAGWDQGTNLQYGPISVSPLDVTLSRGGDAIAFWVAGSFNLESIFASHWTRH
jgi:hypothetical protein